MGNKTFSRAIRQNVLKYLRKLPLLGVLILARYVLVLQACALTYPEEEHHAEHGQQGGDDHSEEDGQLLGLRLPLQRRPPLRAARVLLRGLAGRRSPPLGLIDAGGEAVVEERGPLRHGAGCRGTSCRQRGAAAPTAAGLWRS